MSFKQRIENILRESDEMRKSDVIMMNELLGSDKHLPYLLSEYVFSNDEFDFNKITDVENCFFGIELFSFEKNNFGIEKDLLGRWNFNSSLYHNIYYYLMEQDYRIDVSRTEEKIKDENILHDLHGLGLKNATIVDVEFFEFARWDKQFDISQKIATIDFTRITHSELRDFIKENRLHIEKEKIHLKIIKCEDKLGEKIYLPLYIGLGTNEPYGLALKNNKDKSRWYKMSLDSKYPYVEKGEIKTITEDKNKLNEMLSGKIELIINDNSWDAESKTVIVTIIDLNKNDYENKNNNLLKGFVKFSYKNVENKSLLDKPMSQVLPVYVKDNISRLDEWRDCLTNKNLFSKISDLIGESQKNYECFFELFNCPYKIISEIGTKKTGETLEKKYQKILTLEEFSCMQQCILWGNVTTIASDLYNLGIDSSRNRISALLVKLLIHTDRFKDHIDGDYGKITLK